jgi:hypothetical protein
MFLVLGRPGNEGGGSVAINMDHVCEIEPITHGSRLWFALCDGDGDRHCVDVTDYMGNIIDAMDPTVPFCESEDTGVGIQVFVQAPEKSN